MTTGVLNRKKHWSMVTHLTSESCVEDTVLRGRERRNGIRRVQPSQVREMTVGIRSLVDIQFPFCESSSEGPHLRQYLTLDLSIPSYVKTAIQLCSFFFDLCREP